MWKYGPALMVSLLCGTAGYADNTEMARIKGLIDLAQNNNVFLLKRTAAIDELGQVSTQDMKSILFIQDSFKSLLNKPSGLKDYETNFFRLHVVQAMASSSVDLSSLAPDLCNYVGGEKILNDAITTTLTKIRPPPPTTPPATVSTNAGNIKTWLGDLLNKDAKPAARITALTSLQGLLTAGVQVDVNQILQGLINAPPGPDPSTTILLAKLAKPAYDAATKIKDQQSKTAYIKLLGNMLDPTKSTVFVEAAQALGLIGPDVNANMDVIKLLQTAAGADPSNTDPAVILEAQNALSLITPTKPKQ
jgi:hypothetical protein